MGKIGSTILTFLFSIPITAVGLMAIFGVPQLAPLNASHNNEIVIRDPYEQTPWGSSLGQPAGTSQQTDAPQYNANQTPQASFEAPSWGQSGTTSTPPATQGNPFGHRMLSQAPPIPPISTPQQFPNHPGQHPAQQPGMQGQPSFTSNNLQTVSNSVQANPFANGIPLNRPNTTETSAQMLTWLQASARLSELGIKYHLERGNEEGSFLFVCLYRPQDAPQVTHRFEAEGNDPLVAVNLAIGQVENWLQQQYRNQ